MKYISSGVTREVFLTKRYAFKIPKLRYGWKFFLTGLLANMQERTFSTAGWPELCPIVFSIPGGWLNVQRRAASLTPHEWQNFDRDLFEYGSIERGYIVPIGDWKAENFGVIDGRIVAVDYGS